MVRPYRWLLHRIGPDGIKLGFLPPVHVKAAVEELEVRDWIGAGTVERPVGVQARGISASEWHIGHARSGRKQHHFWPDLIFSDHFRGAETVSWG
jgi:hypothetical protein